MKHSSSKPNNSLSVNKLFAFCGIRNVITAFTRTPHLPISWARSIQTKFSQSSYQRICTSPTFCDTIRNRFSFYGEEMLAHYTNPSCRATPCRQSAAFYAVYSRLPCISGCCLLQPQPEEACREWERPLWHPDTVRPAKCSETVGLLKRPSQSLVQ